MLPSSPSLSAYIFRGAFDAPKFLMTLPSKLPPPPSLFSASAVMVPSIKLYVVPQKSHASRGDVGMATSCGRGSRTKAKDLVSTTRASERAKRYQ